MDCPHFDAGECRSCTLLQIPYVDQVADKLARVQALLVGHAGLTWLPSVTSAESGFRNKAKMVVTGTIERPVLGILDQRVESSPGSGVDLQDCGLHSEGLQRVLPVLAAFVTRASISPYDLKARAGELKHLLVTQGDKGALMVRFVLRSQEPIARIRKHLTWLLEQAPDLTVVSANIQPDHKAVLEGEREIALTQRQILPMRVNDVVLPLRPGAFFQTNTDVAGRLYAQVRDWVAELEPATIWDLYCGVGGFARHVAGPGRRVVGVELSEEAVGGAAPTAPEGVEFVAADVGSWVRERPAPDVVIVNPPRRGIGELADWLEASQVHHVVYSSCNAESLARDLAAMPSLRPVRARLLDMFPQTGHYEVVVLLRRARMKS